MKYIFTFLFVGAFMGLASGQTYKGKAITPDSSTYENIYVKKIYSDEHSSTFAIWVKSGVKKHRHNHHTEVITVLQGKAEMYLGDTKSIIEKGDVVIIPQGTIHSVKTLSMEPLCVISVQSPKFEGKDREWIED